jgi:YVTN family beta-propeller protein
VTNGFSSTVSGIDTTNLAAPFVATNVFVGGGPFGIGLDPGGSRVYVASEDFNEVWVMDAATNTLVTTVPAGTGPSAFGNFVGPLATEDDTCALPEPEARTKGGRGSNPAANNDGLRAACRAAADAIAEAAAFAKSHRKLDKAEQVFADALEALEKGNRSLALQLFHKAQRIADRIAAGRR